jgi:hypothetical protein
MRGSTIRGALVLALLVSSAADPARAQLPAFSPSVNPTQRPTISPYLQLNRGGDPAVNYYGLVRPQLNFQNAEGQIVQAVNSAQQTADQAANQGVIDRFMRPTGHRVGFQTQGRYFLTLSQGASSGGVGGFSGVGVGTGFSLPQSNLQNQGASDFRGDQSGGARRDR